MQSRNGTWLLARVRGVAEGRDAGNEAHALVVKIRRFGPPPKGASGLVYREFRAPIC